MQPSNLTLVAESLTIWPVGVFPIPPGYTSGHSTVSGAASLVMGELFPAEREYFAGQAEEAAISGLWACIHFPRDNAQGLIVGRQIGGKLVDDMRETPHTFIFPRKVAALGDFTLDDSSPNSRVLGIGSAVNWPKEYRY